MPEFDSVIRSVRTVVPEGIRPASVGVRDGRIEAIRSYSAWVSAREVIDLGDTALLPGAIDLGTGVHAPGQDLAESYRLVGEAALRGGVTCVVAAPAPGRPAITCADSLQVHQRAAAGTAVSVVFLGGVTRGTGPLDLADLHAGGVVGFQGSLSDGGAPDMAALGDAQLRKAMAEIASLNALLVVHAEDARELGGRSASAEERPPRAERRGLERVIAAARVVGARTHVAPFTAAECAALLAAAGSVGVELTAHTCPHYLCLPSEYPGPESPARACRPPLRSDANRKALWSSLLENESPILTVGSGHLPAIGLYTLEWSLSALWTAARKRGLSLSDLARWTARAPADLLGLGGRGRIQEGFDADLVAFEDQAAQTVPEADPSPYAGMRLTGRVARVWVSGRSARTGTETARAAAGTAEVVGTTGGADAAVGISGHPQR